MQFLYAVSLIGLVAVELVSGAAIASPDATTVPQLTVHSYHQNGCTSLIKKSRKVIKTQDVCVPIKAAYSVKEVLNQAALDGGCRMTIFMSSDCSGDSGDHDESPECIDTDGAPNFRSVLLTCQPVA